MADSTARAAWPPRPAARPVIRDYPTIAANTASGLPWVLRAGNTPVPLAMAQQHGISELLAGVLAGRGVALDQVPRFLNPTLRDYLPDPFHLKDMDRAVGRIAQAVANGEKVAVFGDYDVDGATSTALLYHYLGQLGMAIRPYIPDRLKEGYGPTEAAFEQLIGEGAQLIATVDCGTMAPAPIAMAQAQGVDVVVLDHHLSGPTLPNAYAVVNPNRYDEASPHRNLAAVGVTFLLLVALNKYLREIGYFNEQRQEPDLLNLLSLVALGTVCDVMPLTGLNRAFVTQGLKILARRNHYGLTALSDIARLDGQPNTYHLGFLLGPRINAGGRVGAADLGVRLLTCGDDLTARDLAATLDKHNAERQAIEADVTEHALRLAEQQRNAPVIVIAGEGWHAGVIGIVAGRLKERYARPVAVIALENGIGKGSARSVMGADLGAAVHAAQTMGIITSGGGHAMAAGFTLFEERLYDFQQFLINRLEASVNAYAESRVLKLDGYLSCQSATMELLDDIARAGPFGLGNPSPRFAIKHARILHRDVLKDAHVKVVLGDEAGDARLSAIAFNVGDSQLGQWLLSERTLHIAGELKRNVWQGKESAQFIIDDVARP